MQKPLTDSPKRQVIYVLVGPKGAGKTYLSTRLQAELGVPFLRVEDIWLALRNETRLSGEAFDTEGQRRVLQAVSSILDCHCQVAIESTATAPWFKHFLEQLETSGEVTLIRIRVPLDQCLARIKERDASVHIPVSDDRIGEINAIAERIELNWALEAKNRDKRDTDRFLAAFKARFLA